MPIKREISNKFNIFHDKLIFVFGPRQAGKTFIIQEALDPNLTLNMDVTGDRQHFKNFPQFVVNWYEREIGLFPKNIPSAVIKRKPVIFIDEIHKVRGWRDLIKGTFDKTAHAVQYVASGSSAFKLRLQEKGDSLAGRAVWLELPPVTFREYVFSKAPDIPLPPSWTPGRLVSDTLRAMTPYQKPLRELWQNYARFGSFPENLVRQDGEFYRQWLKDYLQAMLDRDLKDLTTSRDVDRIYQVFRLLLEGTGSTYSMRSIGETVHAAFETVKGDIRSIKQVLWGFDLPIAALGAARQIRKEKKFYPVDPSFLDYVSPAMEGARFETMAACLLKRSLAADFLGYYRDYSQREVDFVARDNRKIFFAMECKKTVGATHLDSFVHRFKPQEAILLVEEEGMFEKRGGYYISSIELLGLI